MEQNQTEKASVTPAVIQLKNIVEATLNRRRNDSSDGLGTIAEAEKYLQQAYEGRYIFELIQNVRDANRVAGITGSVVIELEDNTLSISNTGMPFTEQGIQSITTIGNSPKDSHDLIGFKGIGFKSVQEITDTPRIITQTGTIVFDRQASFDMLERDDLALNKTPLFYLPQFVPADLTPEEIENGIVTKIVLPLKDGVDLEELQKAFNMIGPQQLIFMGSLKRLHFSSPDLTTTFEITDDTKTGKVEIRKNDQTFYFKHFFPGSRIRISAAETAGLSEKEAVIYNKDPFIDLSIVFNTDANGRLVPVADARLYLFYPLHTVSGFPFLIHSYFIVNPERTQLRDCALNRFILSKTGRYLGGEWLTIAKRLHKRTFLDMLAFERNEQAPLLDALYDSLVETMRGEKFLYDVHTNRFYGIDEIIMADDFDKVLFPEHMIGNKRLIYIANKKTRDWLLKAFEIEYLSYEQIAEAIEAECIRQHKQKRLAYFQNLYDYANKYELDLSSKKVLVSSKWKLLSSEDTVFQGLTQLKTLRIPPSIENRIYFLHPGIRVSDRRATKEQVGFVEFTMEALIRKVLQLYSDEKVPRADVLNFLLQLNIKESQDHDIRRRLLLPVGKHKWVNPFKTAVYVDDDQLRAIYDADNFIDYTRISFAGSRDELNTLLVRFGAWNIPGIYFHEGPKTIRRSDVRFATFTQLSRFNTDVFELDADWLIDRPTTITAWFTTMVIKNFQYYVNVMNHESNPVIHYKSPNSGNKELPASIGHLYSQVLAFLKSSKWIVTPGNSTPLATNEIIGIDELMYYQPHNASLRKYLSLLPINYHYNADILDDLGMLHFDRRTVKNYVDLFKHVCNLHTMLPENGGDFMTFYNKLLSRLYELYQSEDFEASEWQLLKDTPFLARVDGTDELRWLIASKIYYIEDKPFYDLLPAQVRARFQPQFTNHDKGRFGMIGKNIGQDFRKQIVREIKQASIIKTITVEDYFPFFAEVIGIAEVLLGRNLNEFIEIVKDLPIKVCSSLSLQLSVSEFRMDEPVQFAHIIVEGNKAVFYAIVPPAIERGYHLSKALQLLFSHFLGRDTSIVQSTVHQFYIEQNKTAFLDRYHVSEDLMSDIKAKLHGFSFSAEQYFWFDYLAAAGVTNTSSFFDGEDIYHAAIATAVGIPYDLSAICDRIDFANLHASENHSDWVALFSGPVTIAAFNKVAVQPISYSNHYSSLLYGHALKQLPFFETVFHAHLSTQHHTRQVHFRQIIADYKQAANWKIEDALLADVDMNAAYQSRVSHFYDEASWAAVFSAPPSTKSLQPLYNANYKALILLINDPAKTKEQLANFLLSNIQNSLLYFDDNLQTVADNFTTYCKSLQPTIQPAADGTLPLDRYKNSPGLDIQGTETNDLPGLNRQSKNGLPKKTPTKRVDGKNNSEQADLVGIVAEKMVYEKLCEKYQCVEWVSANAFRAGVNSEGSDHHHYDIFYIDENDAIQYVEVKGKIDDVKCFKISKYEIHTALEHKLQYRIIFVPFTLDNNKRLFLDLGNIFMLPEGQDILYNQRFTAEYDLLEIRFA